MPLRLSLRELEVFCAIARHENVNRAAGDVALTQSAASQALARLEEALDVQLFDRHGRRLLLNEHGRLLLPRARALLDGALSLQGLFDGGALSLRLGASTTIASYVLPQRLAAFRRLDPDARLELTVGNTRAVVDAVAAFDVDLGLIEGPCHHPELELTPWLDDELVVFAAAGHPLTQARCTPQQLADAPWLLREPGSGTREEVERLLLPHLGRLRLDMELGDSEAIRHAVAAGLGVSCLSRRVVADALAAGRVAAVDAGLPPLRRTLYLVRHRDKAVTRGMQAFTRLQEG